MSSTDDLLVNARAHAADFGTASIPLAPARKVVIVACMDARINLYRIFGLDDGDAHIVRNAGGAVTDDTIRSLAISQRLAGTEEIILVHHTDCALVKVSDDAFRERIRSETGIRPPWATEAFGDLDADVRQSMARILASPFVPVKASVRGFVYDVTDGSLREIDAG